MNEFGATRFSAAPISTVAASEATHLVRYGEMQSLLAAIQADVDAVTAAQAASEHDAVTVPDTNNSLALVLAGQALTGEVVLVPESEYQAAGTGQTQQYFSPASGDILDLGKLLVSNVVVMVGATGAVLDTDYLLDAATGLITVLAGSLLIGQTVDVTFDCAQVLSGPALEITVNGVQCKLGSGHHQAARGDHTHADLHKPLSVTDGASLNLTINPGQRLTGEVVLAASSGLLIESGLKVDTTVIATKSSVDSAVAAIAALDVRIDALEAAAVVVSVADTDSLDLSISGSNQITGVVKVGEGLKITTAVGVEVDFTSVAAANITDNHETRIAALEAGTVLPCPLPMIVPCSGNSEAVAAGTPVTFRMPGNVTLTSVRASLTSAATTGTLTVDIKVNGLSILSTLLTIDATEKTSVTATAPAVISTADIDDDDEVEIIVTDDADGTATGLKVYLVGVTR